jgi:hypothetical protein
MADDFAFELRDTPHAEPWTLEQINAFVAECEAGKRILACAPDVYGRIRQAVESGPLAAYFRVIEQPLLKDGQVFSIDPAVLKVPPPEIVIDPEVFAPQYRCRNCLKPVHTPGHCSWCEVFATTYRPPFAPGIITGLT